MAQEMPLPTRRDVMAGAAVLALTAVPALAQGTAATARGTVFDADSSPRTGVPNVMVSNGLDVVKTGDDGGWSGPVRDGNSLFVIKPAGWALPVDAATNLPRFAYVHAPSGSPDLGFRFAGIAPTGRCPKASTSGCGGRQKRRHSSGAVHRSAAREPDRGRLYPRRVVSVVDASQAAFGITHGDIMFDDLSYYPRYNRIVGTIGLPWFNCRGNHDMNLEAPDNAHCGRDVQAGLRRPMACVPIWRSHIHPAGQCRLPGHRSSEAQRVREIPWLFRRAPVGLGPQRAGECAARQPGGDQLPHSSEDARGDGCGEQHRRHEGFFGRDQHTSEHGQLLWAHSYQ